MIFKNGFTAGRFGESSAVTIGSALLDTGFGRTTGVVCVVVAPRLVVGDGAFFVASEGDAFFALDFVPAGLELRFALVGVVPTEKLPCVEVKSWRGVRFSVMDRLRGCCSSSCLLSFDSRDFNAGRLFTVLVLFILAGEDARTRL